MAETMKKPINTWQDAGVEQAWEQLTQPSTWDAIVVGGGITGAGIAREAARRGLRVLLLERQDFAWGTSSRSSKMVHGGLRYIAAGDVKTTMHSVHERERLMQELPGLVDRMGYLMAHYQGGFPGPFVFNTLLRIYDFFAGKKYRQYFPAAAFQWRAPYIQSEQLLGGTQFADAVTDDSRLVMRVLREAQRDGACVLNYVSVDRLCKEEGRVTGVHVTNQRTQQTLLLQAHVVINATGAWADELRQAVSDQRHIRPARGSHIVLPQWRLPSAQALTVLHPEDRRPIFIFPWEGRTVVGTTDLDNNGIANEEASMTRDELRYLLKVVDAQYPSQAIVEADVISSWAGVRPLVSSGALNPSKEKRDHSVWDEQGLVSVSGGKLTTFRLIALDVLAKAKRYIPNYPVGQFSEQLFTPMSRSLDGMQHLPKYLQRRLQGHYGADLPSLLALAVEGDFELIPGSRTLWLELRWAAQHEAIHHLDDLLLRRTRLGLLLPQGGLLLIDRIRHVSQAGLTWDDARWQHEIERYRTLWQRHYGIPNE